MYLAGTSYGATILAKCCLTFLHGNVCITYELDMKLSSKHCAKCCRQKCEMAEICWAGGQGDDLPWRCVAAKQSFALVPFITPLSSNGIHQTNHFSLPFFVSNPVCRSTSQVNPVVKYTTSTLLFKSDAKHLIWIVGYLRHILPIYSHMIRASLY